MYIKDAQRYPDHFRKPQVDKIVGSLSFGNSLTIFAPSGFGKSTLMRYLAYNSTYRSRYRKLSKVKFVYINSMELAVELRDLAQSIAASVDPGNSSQTQLVREIMLEGLRNSIPNLRTDSSKKLTEHLDKLFNSHPKMQLFFILDAVENIFTPEFEMVRDLLKYVRDRYRGQLGYIFVTSQSKYLHPKNYDRIGKLSSLFSQKILVLPLIPTARYLDLEMYDGNRLFYNLFLANSASRRSRLNKIDSYTGGYPPYVQYLIRSGLISIPDNNLIPQELDLASKRLLASLELPEVWALREVAINSKINANLDSSKLLYELGLINFRHSHPMVFSPIMDRYLKTIPPIEI